MDRRQRRSVRDYIEDFYGQQIQFTEVPHFTVEELLEGPGSRNGFELLMFVTARHAYSIKQLLSGYPMPGTFDAGVGDVYELGAVSSQILQIMIRFGGEVGQNIFNEHIRDTPYGRLYGHIIPLIKKEPFIEEFARLGSAISIWSIAAGPPTSQSRWWMACPAVRFRRLIAKLHEGALLLDQIPTEDLLGQFDRLMGEAGTCDRIDSGTRHFECLSREIVQAFEISRFDQFKNIPDYWRFILDTRPATCGALRSDPASYISGRFHFGGSGKIVLPPVYQDFSERDPDLFPIGGLPAGAQNWVLRGSVMMRYSDETDHIADACTATHVIDRITSKAYFATDGSITDRDAIMVRRAFEKMTGVMAFDISHVAS